jgi:hypothetical protein
MISVSATSDADIGLAAGSIMGVFPVFQFKIKNNGMYYGYRFCDSRYNWTCYYEQYL